MEITFHNVELTDSQISTISDFVKKQNTLHDVVVVGLAMTPPIMVADVVIQDEYTHDIVFPFANVWLVYDTT